MDTGGSSRAIACGSGETAGCVDCRTNPKDVGNEKWEAGDLTDIQEFVGHVCGRAKPHPCDRTVASQMAKDLLGHPEQITSSLVTEVLNNWRFAKT